jgi:hypothetical protein
VNFKELTEHLADEIGYHQVPLNACARGVDEILESCALHHELMMRLMRAIHRHNDCRKLTDRVTRVATLEAIAPIRLEVLHSPRTDIDTKRLMDDICAAVDKAFEHESVQVHGPDHAAAATQKKHGEVISLDGYRRRLKSLP